MTSSVVAWTALMCALAGVARAAPEDHSVPPSPSPSSPPGASPSPIPSPSPRPGPTPPPRLRLDVEKQVDKVLSEAPPHFEATVEVIGKSPQDSLAAQFKDLDLECGPAAGGAPTEVETRAFRPHQSPSLDLAALAMAIAGKLKPKGPDHYFLYRVLRRDGGVGYVLREERMPASALYASGGATFDLVEAFPDRDTAMRAWRRLEQGFRTAVPADAGAPLPLWVTSPCRPRK